MAFDCPIFINVRDRVTQLRKLVDWLERAGHQRIVLIDNASTYPELLEYLDKSPHTVWRLEQNLGKLALWKLNSAPDEPFVLTDPDIVPIEDCPLDAVERFHGLLQRHPFPKAGFGLYLDDLPAHASVLGHEKALMDPRTLVEAKAFASAIDTTFALYQPGHGFQMLAIRTGKPYMARHECISWYGGTPTEEDRFYFEHADQGSEGSSGARRVRLG